MDESRLDALAADVLAVGASGAVLAVRDASVTIMGTAGEGMTASTRFHFGSIGKCLLAAVVLGLVDEGRLDLDAPLEVYLPGVVANSDTISIRHLLQHTSGLRDFLQEESFLTSTLAESARPEPAAVLRLVRDDPLFAPGEGWAYASTNYLVLALVVETVEELPLREVLRVRLAEPQGLIHTELPPIAGDPPAKGHTAADNWLFPGETDSERLTHALAYGADAIVSTPSEVARFLGAFIGGELLGPESTRNLLQTVPADELEFDEYGLGIGKLASLFGLAPSPCGSAWGHLGLATGHTTVALSRRDASRQVVLAVDRGLLPETAWSDLGRVVWRAFCD
jgi:D-alanyl-D-alanine carboxypeptidase